jgi:hypothetical protein
METLSKLEVSLSPAPTWYEKNRERKKEYQKHYDKTHAEQIGQYRRTYRQHLKLEVFSHYSKGIPKCAICGQDNLSLLELDHLDNKGKEHRTLHKYTVGTGTWLWAKRNNYPQIFQVLCSKCNLKKGPLTPTVIRSTALTVEQWMHDFFDKSWEACESCGLMSCQHNEIVCPFRDFKVIPRFLAKPSKENHI